MTTTWVWMAVGLTYVVFGFIAFRFIWALRVAPLPEDMPEAQKNKIMGQRRQWAIEGRSGPFLLVTVLPDFVLALVLLPLYVVAITISCIVRPSGFRRVLYFARHARYPPRA